MYHDVAPAGIATVWVCTLLWVDAYATAIQLGNVQIVLYHCSNQLCLLNCCHSPLYAEYSQLGTDCVCCSGRHHLSSPPSSAAASQQHEHHTYFWQCAAWKCAISTTQSLYTLCTSTCDSAPLPFIVASVTASVLILLQADATYGHHENKSRTFNNRKWHSRLHQRQKKGLACHRICPDDLCMKD